VFEKPLCDFRGSIIPRFVGTGLMFHKGRRHGCRVSDGLDGRVMGGDLEVDSGVETRRATAYGGHA
jgi:hypothetical protein